MTERPDPLNDEGVAMGIEQPGADVSALFPPYFPLAKKDVIPPPPETGPAFGLSISDFDIPLLRDATRQNATPVSVDPVQIDPTVKSMTVYLYINNQEVDSKYVTGADLNEKLDLKAPQSNFREGVNKAWLIYSLDSGNTSKSPELTLLYSRKVPGGNTEPLVLHIDFSSQLGDPPRIGPDDLSNGVILEISYDNQKPYDELMMDVNGAVYSFTVQPSEVGKPYIVIFTMEMYIALGKPSALTFLFTVIDQLNNATYRRTWSNTIRAAVDPVDARLHVMGARAAAVQFWANKGASRFITAIDKTTQIPLRARWRYDGDINEVAAAHFDDTHPERLLHVRYGTQSVVIRPANFFGNGFCNLENHNEDHSAFVAVRDNGTIKAWGNSDNGGELPDPNTPPGDVTAVAWSMAAFAALRHDGSVVAWGDPGLGGKVPPLIAGLRDIRHLCTAGQAIAALRANNSVVAWGVGVNGGLIPDNIGQLKNIRHICATATAFAVHLADGSVRTWGDVTRGGSVPAAIGRLTNIAEVINNHDAFAARLTDGSVVAWGNDSTGGLLPENLNHVARIISAGYAFVAHLESGHVKAWGRPDWGGSAPASILALDNIIDVVGAGYAFAALLDDHRVVAWGDSSQGGVVPTEIAMLRNIVQLATTNGAFAALCSDGTVVTWGNRVWGGDSSLVSKRLKKVVAIYSNSEAFVALTEDRSIVTWGLAGSGGYNTTVEYDLLEEVSYLASTTSQNVAGGLSTETATS